MCDHVTGSLGAAHVDHEDSCVNKRPQQDVLNMKFNALPKTKLIGTLDEDPDTVIELGLQYGFSREMIDDMKDKQFGGGKPHVRFIELVQSKGFPINQVKDAMIRAGINEDRVKEHFSVAEEKQYNYFNDFTPREISPLITLLREDVYNCNQPNWKHVAEELGMDDVINYVSSTRVQGGTFSIGKAFCNIISCKNLTINEFKTYLDNQLSRMRENGECTTIVDKIYDMYMKAIDDKVKFQLRADQQKTQRANRLRNNR